MLDEVALPEPTEPPAPDAVGQRLRARRLERGISLRELARRVGVSASFISQVELGRASPSVGTLYSLVNELDVSIDDLLNGEPAVSATVVPRSEETRRASRDAFAHVLRADDRPTVRLGGVTWQHLSPSDEAHLDLLVVTYLPGSESCSEDSFMRHKGHEYGHVTSGRLCVQVGFTVHELGPGDTINFESSTPHRLWNPYSEPCTGMWLVLDHDLSQAAHRPS